MPGSLSDSAAIRCLRRRTRAADAAAKADVVSSHSSSGTAPVEYPDRAIIGANSTRKAHPPASGAGTTGRVVSSSRSATSRRSAPIRGVAKPRHQTNTGGRGYPTSAAPSRTSPHPLPCPNAPVKRAKTGLRSRVRRSAPRQGDGRGVSGAARIAALRRGRACPGGAKRPGAGVFRHHAPALLPPRPDGQIMGEAEHHRVPGCRISLDHCRSDAGL